MTANMRPAFLLASLSLVLGGCVHEVRIPEALNRTDWGGFPALQPRPAPLADLVRAVDIPYERFTLANGLTVLVYTDRKTPIVGVTTYYRVGSKNEPRGKTGFAHLYEHLFFGGSQNVPSFDVPLEAAGSTSTNGSTWYDRTNYVETVPTGALDLALMLESDRMGHLLGAVTQDKLDTQRAVVQNEKRQGDNEPFGLASYLVNEALLPVGHPYRHAPIGSMADLDAATLADVRDWFRDNYGPNNVVLTLTGDIDAATARAKVERWFGDIPAGPAVSPVAAGPVTLPSPVSREIADQVPNLRFYRAWTGPGIKAADALALDLGMRVLGGLSGSRLDNALVRGEQLATSVTASRQQHEQLSFLEAMMNVRPGGDRAAAEARFDAVIAQFLAEGPSEDELRRAATQAAAEQIAALEEVGGFGGKGATLAEGQLYSGDPARFRAELEAIAQLTPVQVKEAMQRWLGRPAVRLAVVPGERTISGDALGGWGDEASSLPRPKGPPSVAPPVTATGAKRDLPAVAPVGALTFPAVERFRLANGIPVTFARRTGVPKVNVAVSFDAGYVADRFDSPGAQSLTLDLLEAGTTRLNATALAEEQERLGASIASGTSPDASIVQLDALSANLAPSLALLAEVIRQPAFTPAEVTRLKAQRLAAIAEAKASPTELAIRSVNPILYGPGHPYGMATDGLGEEASVSSLTPEAIRTVHDRWLRPDLAQIVVVGDTTLAELQPRLEQAFGAWRAPSAPAPAKRLDAPVPTARARIVLLDRPNSPQSVILAGRVLPLTGRDQGHEALDLANEVLGAGFLSRLMADLREDKGWSYGVSSWISAPNGPRRFTVLAPVQTDRTGDSIREILKVMRAFPANRPVAPDELGRVTDGNIRGLPNRFVTNAQVLAAIMTSDRLGRPDNYYATLPDRYRTIDATALNAAARTWLQADGLTFIVVGDRKVVEPQLRGLGLPVEVTSAVDSATPKD